MKDEHLPAPASGLRLFSLLKGWIAVAVFCGASLAVYHSAGGFFDARDFNERAIILDAEVVEAREERRMQRLHHVIELRYVLNDEPRTLELDVPRGVYSRAQRQETLAIAFEPDRPGVPIVPADRVTSRAQTWLALSVLALAAVCGWLIFIESRVKQARKTRDEGERVSARVSKIAYVGNASLGPVFIRFYRLHWIEASGRAGSSVGRSRMAFSALSEGSHLWVYRKGPHAWWEGDVGGPM
ncbi:MAG: hypothetical protein AAFP28_12110 [Pseudomonadota bacterium]